MQCLMPNVVLLLTRFTVAADISTSDVRTYPLEDVNSTGSYCCSQLQSRFGSLISFPNTTVYETQQSKTTGPGYWSAFEIEVQPACRVIPTSTKHVSRIVVELSAHECQFAVRGGGHMWWAGSANIEDGVTIDLSAMDRVVVAEDHTVTKIGAGARWGDVYLKLDAMSLSVVGGRVYDVGVAGLTLGGGNSFFATRFGFVCDNVKNFEVVLGTGRIVNVNIDSHPDLFKALKGGLNNFGIVTRFDLKTFPQGKIWGGFVAYPSNTSSYHLDALRSFTDASAAGEDDYATIENVNSFTFTPTRSAIVANIFAYTKPVAYPRLFENFTKIVPQLANDLRITNLTNITIEAGAGIPNGGRYLFAMATFANNATILAKANEILNNTFSNLTNIHGNLSATNVFQPIPISITKHAATTGGNSLGLTPDMGNVIWDNFGATWTDLRDDEAIFAASQKWVDEVNAYTKAEGQYKAFVYSNYALPSQDAIASYGAENVKQLKRVSRKYDLKQVFQRLVRGGSKLPK